MLQRIGDALSGHKWFTYTILGGLSLFFALWGVYGIAQLRFGGSDSAAKVNGEVIPQEDVRRTWQNEQSQWQQRFGTDVPAAMKGRLQDEILERYIRRAAIDQHTLDAGYRVSDAQLQDAIRSLPDFQLDGQYSEAVARQHLDQLGIPVQKFEQDMRDGLRMQQVQAGIMQTEFLTRPEMARLQMLQNEQREVSYLELPLSKYLPAVQLDDAAVQAWYQQHQAQYMNPETVRVQYAELRLAQLASQQQITQDDAREYYAKNKDRYVLPERRHAEHILIATSKTRDDAAALKRAQEVLAKARAPGADFAALAKEYSDDQGSAAQGGDLGFAEKTNFVPPFADALFAMKPGEIAGPVKTQYGYHIIRLEAVAPGKTKSFEEARAEIEAQLRHDKAADRFGDIQEQLQEKLDQTGTTLEGLAKQFGMELGEVAQFQRDKGGAPLGDSKELEDAVFGDAALGEHRIAGPVLIGEDRLVLVRDLEHHAAAPKPLAEVRAQVETGLRQERATQAARAAAQSAAERVRAGTSLEQVARSLALSAQAARFVGRTDPSVPAAIRSQVFDAPKPAPNAPVVRAFALADGSAAVIDVTAVKEGADASAPPMSEEQKRQAAERMGGAAVTAYLEQVRLDAKVVKNPAAFEEPQQQ